MATLAEIRAQYPEYSDLSDADLAEGLYRKFYSDMPREEFNAKVGLAAAPVEGPLQPRSINSAGPEAYSGPSYVSPPGGRNNPEPGFGRSVRLAVENTVSTANKVLGMPVDLATMALNAPGHAFNIPAKLLGYEGVGPLVTNPVGGSQWLQDRSNELAQLVDPSYAPVASADKTPRERAIQTITEMAGLGAAGGLGLARVAATRLASPNTMPRFGDSLLKTYAERPGAAVAADTAAGAGSGVGASLAREYLPGDPIAEFVATVIGAPFGMAAMRAGQGVGNAVKGVVDRFTGTGIPNDPATPFVPTRGRVVDQAARAAQESASNPEQALGNLRESMRVFEQEGMPQPTAGLQSNDIGLIGAEQAARRANSKPFIESDARVQEAAADQVGQMRPDVSEGDMRLPQQMAKNRAAALTDAGERRAQRTEDRLNQTNQQLAANDEANRTLAAPVRAEAGGARRAEASRQLDEQVNASLTQRTAEKNAQFNNLPDTETPLGQIRRTTTRIREQANPLVGDQAMPAEFMQRLDALDAKNMPLNQLAETRRYLNTASERAQKAGNFELSDNIRTLKRQINQAIEAHPDAAAANAYYRNEYAPFFAEGRGRTYRDKVQRDPMGRQDLPPEKVAQFFLDNDANANHLARIMEVAPDPAAAQRAARSYLISDLARSATNPDGTVNPAMVRQWLENNRGKLTSPELAPIQNEIQQLQRNVLNNRAAGDAMAGEVTRLGQRLRQIGKTNKEIERAIDNGALGTLIRNSPVNAAKEVIASGGDPVARAAAMNKVLDRAPLAIRQRVKDAWGAAVVDALQERIGTTRNAPGTETAALSHAALVKELDRHSELLKEVFRGDPDKLRKLNNARTALEVLSRKGQQATTGSVTSEAAGQQKQRDLMIEAGLKAYYGVLKGGGLNRTWNVLKRTIMRDDSPDVARLLERAFTEDPRIMEKLLTREVQAPRPGYNTKLNRAIGAKEAYTDDEDKPKEPLRIRITPDAPKR